MLRSQLVPILNTSWADIIEKLANYPFSHFQWHTWYVVKIAQIWCTMGKWTFLCGWLILVVLEVYISSTIFFCESYALRIGVFITLIIRRMISVRKSEEMSGNSLGCWTFYFLMLIKRFIAFETWDKYNLCVSLCILINDKTQVL